MWCSETTAGPWAAESPDFQLANLLAPPGCSRTATFDQARASIPSQASDISLIANMFRRKLILSNRDGWTAVVPGC
jgi:hypothetical protein